MTQPQTDGLGRHASAHLIAPASTVSKPTGPLKSALEAAAALATVATETSAAPPAPTAAPIAPAPAALLRGPPAQAHLQFAMPLHPVVPSLAGVAGAFPFISHPFTRTGSEVPSIFQGRKLRSGKWTQAEETYADILIELFEKGHINEKNGSTLRSFLSRKLHCAPMRISKKYAGKGIGKMVFLSKTGISGVDGYGSQAYKNNMKRLMEAETKFLKDACPELDLVCSCLQYSYSFPAFESLTPTRQPCNPSMISAFVNTTAQTQVSEEIQSFSCVIHYLG